MTQHTPGPWEVLHDSPPLLKQAGPRGKYIARLLEQPGLGLEAESNYRLIAAAPELLEALRAAVNACHYISTLETAPKATRDLAYKHMQAADAAIAKATGDVS